MPIRKYIAFNCVAHLCMDEHLLCCVLSALMLYSVFDSKVDMKKQNFLKEKIRHYFLDNKHHLMLTMTPKVSRYPYISPHLTSQYHC